MATRAATVIGFVHFFTVLLVLTIYANLIQLSPNYARAAEDLGASRFQVIRLVILPLTLPGVMTGAFLTFVLCIGDYITPQILRGNNELTLPQLIMLQLGRRGDYPMASALSLVLMAIVTLAYAASARSLKDGAGMMRVVAWFLLALLFGFVLLPVVVLVIFSFQDGRLPVPPFNGPTLRWYAEIMSDRALMPALMNSLIVALSSSAIALLLGFLAASGLARVVLPGSALMRGLLIAPMTVSDLIIALGLLQMFNRVGLRPSLLATGIGHGTINLPLCFAIIYAAMGDHQKNAMRAARDLGGREWQVLWHVSAPMLLPSRASAFFLAFTFSWDEFIIAFLLTRFNVTLPVEIWSMLRSGLSPATNAVGSLVFLVSVAIVVALELTLFRRKTE